MEELTRIRKEQGLSQRRLATLAGVDYVALNQIENGRRDPALKTLEKLARALRVDVRDFFPRTAPTLFEDTPTVAAPDLLEISRDEFRRWVADMERLAEIDDAIRELKEHAAEITPAAHEGVPSDQGVERLAEIGQRLEILAERGRAIIGEMARV